MRHLRRHQAYEFHDEPLLVEKLNILFHDPDTLERPRVSTLKLRIKLV